jgi:hypothetical protein
MARKRDKPTASPPQSRRVWWQVMAIGTVFIVGGLTQVVASTVYMWQQSEKADRLRAEGVPVTAAVSGFASGGSGRGSGPDTVTVTYTYEGETYQTRIRCGGWTGCANEPDPETTVWADPDKPDEFVAANGNTDGSLSFLNSWAKVVAGVLFALIGGVGMAAVLFGDRLIGWWQTRKARVRKARD